MLLICPPKNWQNPLPIEESALPLLQELAQRLGLAYNYQPTQGKVYFGPAEEVDAAEPALSEPTPEATPEEVAAQAEPQKLAAYFITRLPSSPESSIVDGVVMLQGRQYKACSGAIGAQVYGQYFCKGAPIPPGSYELDLNSYYCATPGIEGTFYHILPDPIWSEDGSKKRTEIGLHRDAGVAGTAGCIGVVGADFYALDEELQHIAHTQKTLPLEVSYLCRD